MNEQNFYTEMKRKQRITIVGVIAGICVLLLIIFGWRGKTTPANDDEELPTAYVTYQAGKEVRRVTADEMSAGFSPKGKYIILWDTYIFHRKYTASMDDDVIHAQEVLTGKEVLNLWYRFGARTRGVWFTADDKYAIVNRDVALLVIDAESGNRIARIETGDKKFGSRFISPDGRYLFSYASETTLLMDIFSEKEIYRTHHAKTEGSYASGTYSATVSQDWKYALIQICDKPYKKSGEYTTRCSQYSTHIIDIYSGKEVVHVTTNHPNSKFVGGGNQYMIVKGADFQIWDAVTGKEIGAFPKVNALHAFSPDGKYMIFVDKSVNDKTAKVMEISTKKEITTIQQDDWIYFLAFSPNNKYIISKGSPGFEDTRTYAYVWEALTGRESARIVHNKGITDVKFSADGKYVVSAGCDEEEPLPADVPFLDGPTTICTSSSVRVWDSATGREIARMTVDNSTVDAPKFSPDGKYILVITCDKPTKYGMGCYQESARLWQWGLP
jgi:WD40 repeat protein